MANGFHIDGNGNLWLGSTSTTFTTSAPFYVQTDGTVHAEQGDIGGLDIGANYIQSSNFSNTNQAGYRLQSDGNVIFYGTLLADDANISGTITATSGTVGGTKINASNIESNTFNNTTGYQIGANSATFHDVTITGTLSGADIDGTVSGTLATANSGQRIEFSNTGSAIMQFYSNTGQSGYVADVSGDLTLQAQANSALVLSGGTNGIKWSGVAHFESGGSYSNTTNTNFVIKADSNGKPYWGSVPATAGVTSITAVGNIVATGNANTGAVIITDNHESHTNLANSGHIHNATNTNNLTGLDDSHNHTSTNAAGALTGLTASNILVSSTANNNTGVYHSHVTGNVSSINVLGNMLSKGNSNEAVVIYDNHTTSHHDNSDHTGNNNNNLATVGYVNSRGFGTGNGNGNGNGNSNLGSHDNGSHNVAYGTGNGNGNSNINSADVNSIVDNNFKVVSGYNHSTSTHNNGNGNGNMTQTNHYNGNISVNTHFHPNPIIHDSRLLNINANTVPGVNFVNRLNPVQTNFIGNVETRLTSKENLSGFITEHLTATAFTLTAQDVKQALTDDGYTDSFGMVLDNVDYYTEEHGSDLDEGETVKGFSQEHMVPILVQAIKDLSAKIETLEDRITTLEG